MTLSTEQNHQDKIALIGRLTAGLTHDLAGPIGIALGFTELAKETLQAGHGGIDGQSAQKVSEYLNLIESSARRARELTRYVTDFAKSEPGTVQELDLTALVEHAATLARLGSKGTAAVEYVQKGDVKEVPVMADRAIVIHNLVLLMLGSTEALPSGGRVYWEVRPTTDGTGGEFTLTAEPWDENSSNEWPVGEQVRSVFESQGGTINPVTGVSMKGGGSSALAWIVSGTLPAVSGALNQAI